MRAVHCSEGFAVNHEEYAEMCKALCNIVRAMFGLVLAEKSV